METENRGMHALALVGVGFLLSIAVTAYLTPPASGYEVDIYASYPLHFWLSIAGAIFVGQLLILRSAVFETEDRRGRVFGLLFALVPVLALTLLPYFRGYPVYGRADVLTHLGLVLDLPVYGIEENIYPPTHLLLASLNGATGLEPITLINLLSVAFTALFFGSMYLLVVHLFSNRAVAAFALLFVVFPITGALHITSVPYAFSVLLTPFVLYLLLKEQRTQRIPIRMLLLVGIVGVVLFHPLTAVFLIATFVTYAVVKRIPLFDTEHLGPSHAASFALLIFGGWYLDNAGIIIRFQNVITDFLNPEAGGSDLATTSQTVERTGASLVDVVQIAIFRYGSEMIVFGLATVFLAIVAVLWLRNREAPGVFTAAFGSSMLLFTGLSVLFLTNDFIVSFGRPLGFGVIFAAPLAGVFWYVMWPSMTTSRRRTVAIGVLSIVLVAAVWLTVVSMFTSPLVAETNQQTTQMEIDGMEWAFEHRNDDLLIDEFGIRQYRFDDLEHGAEGQAPSIRREGTRPPDHFNYTTYDTLGESYANDRYFVLTRLGRVTYPARYPEYQDQWRFTAADFERLQQDQSVARVYDNGEFDMYWVNGSTTAAPE